MLEVLEAWSLIVQKSYFAVYDVAFSLWTLFFVTKSASYFFLHMSYPTLFFILLSALQWDANLMQSEATGSNLGLKFSSCKELNYETLQYIFDPAVNIAFSLCNIGPAGRRSSDREV